MKNLEAPVTAASDIASKYTWGGAGVGVVAAFAQVDWAMWIGIFVAVGGWVMNLIFKIREDKRAQELHEYQKKMIEKGIFKNENK